MKIKRLLAGIVACAMAVSAMAITASAAITHANDGDDYKFDVMADLGDDFAKVTKIEVTIDVPDMSGGAGGGFILNSNSTGWKSTEFGDADSGKDITFGDDFILVYDNGGEPIFAEDDEYAQVVIQSWWGDFSVESIDYAFAEDEGDGEDEKPGDGDGEEPEGEEVVNPIIGKTFIQNQGGSWDWYDSGDTEFEGEGSTIDVSLDLTNPEIELYDPVEDWEDNLGIQVADVRVDEEGKSTEFSYKVDAASIVVAGETIDLDISEYSEEIEVTTLGKKEDWGVSGGDDMISLKDQVEALADEAGVSYMEYLATIDSLDATITLISYSGAVVDTPAEEEDEDDDTKTPDAKNPSTGAGGIVAVVGMSALALTAVTVSRKRK